MSVRLIILLSWLEGLKSIFYYTPVGGTKQRLLISRKLFWGTVDIFHCKMILYLNILMLLLLQPALLSPMLLTAPSRGCSTCKGKPSQNQPSVDLNATSLAAGEPCGVYTVSCAHGLRCAPPEDEPRPLRALLEGRGVCNIASSVSPTEGPQTVGKSQFVR